MKSRWYIKSNVDGEHFLLIYLMLPIYNYFQLTLYLIVRLQLNF